jgi:DNA-nicking Smr family endonuclease
MSEDKQFWEAYKSVVAVAAKQKRKASVAKSVLKSAAEKAAQRKAAESAPPRLPRTDAGQKWRADALRSLERKREKSLRQGEIEIDARLDLHGMTQVEAFAALAAFMHKQTKSGKRHLLIITGKGRGGDGVLRNNLQGWLSHLPEAGSILALRPASRKHGGDGAFYIILRHTKRPMN